MFFLKNVLAVFDMGRNEMKFAQRLGDDNMPARGFDDFRRSEPDE